MFKQEKVVFIILSVVYAVIGYCTYKPTMQSLSLMGWFGLVQFIYCIISWIKRGNQFVSPYIIFLCCLYIFSYGQSFLWAFNIETERSLVYSPDISIHEIFIAQVQTIIMLAFFHIGAIHYIQKQRYDDLNYRVHVNYTNRLKQVGWFLFIISVVPYLSETINDMFLSMTKGYMALYQGEEQIGINNISNVIADYFIPSLICLFIVYSKNKTIRTTIVVFLLFNIIAILVTGGRSNAVILLAILGILYNYLVKRFTRKWLVIGAVGICLLLQVLAIVASFRSSGLNAASKEGVKIENNAAVDAVAEMGGTMFCLIKTENIVPSKQPYRYGKSYVYAFTTLIPNLGFWEIHPAKKESNLGDWLTEELGLGYGTGFSMTAEAYANFGYFGFIAFFFWGWFLANIFGKIEISAQTRNYALMAFSLILFWFFLKLPRNCFINLVRPIFFVAAPIYLYCTKVKRN